MWLLPLLIVGLAAGLAVPLGRYMARALDPKDSGGSHTRLARNAVERMLDTGPQTWKQYCFALLGFNALAFVLGFAVLALQSVLPLNPDGKGMLAPSTIFNTAAWQNPCFKIFALG